MYLPVAPWRIEAEEVQVESLERRVRLLFRNLNQPQHPTDEVSIPHFNKQSDEVSIALQQGAKRSNGAVSTFQQKINRSEAPSTVRHSGRQQRSVNSKAVNSEASTKNSPFLNPSSLLFSITNREL